MEMAPNSEKPSGEKVVQSVRSRRLWRMKTSAAPRVLRIDDWARSKGYRYGTILCDLEASKVGGCGPGIRAKPPRDCLPQG
jgi:hypothetical protein